MPKYSCSRGHPASLNKSMMEMKTTKTALTMPALADKLLGD